MPVTNSMRWSHVRFGAAALPKTVADSIFGAVTELRTMFLPEPPLSILAVPQEIDGKHCDPLVTLDTHPPHLGEPGGSGSLRRSYGPTQLRLPQAAAA
jgi:hypothetical protein